MVCDPEAYGGRTLVGYDPDIREALFLLDTKLEIPSVFQGLNAAPEIFVRFRDDDLHALARRMREMWVAFAPGHRGADRLRDSPRYTAGRRTAAIFNFEPSVVYHPASDHREIWAGLL